MICRRFLRRTSQLCFSGCQSGPLNAVLCHGLPQISANSGETRRDVNVNNDDVVFYGPWGTP